MAFLRFLLQTGRSDKPHSVDLFVETNAEIEKSSVGAACLHYDISKRRDVQC